MYDAILTRGGGINEDGSFPEWVKRRLDKVIKIFTDNEIIITLSAGTTHKPHPLDENKFPIYESVAQANYLISKGIPKEKILTDTISLDTIGNAFFSRVIFTELRDLRKLCIITSQFHMSRTKAIFKWVFGLNSNGYSLDFVEVSDNNLDMNLRIIFYKLSFLDIPFNSFHLHTLNHKKNLFL